MITVNGKKQEFRCVQVLQLVTSNGYSADTVAVEKNGTMLSRVQWNKEEIVDGDVFEIIHFVGGG